MVFDLFFYCVTVKTIYMKKFSLSTIVFISHIQLLMSLDEIEIIHYTGSSTNFNAILF